MAPTKHCALPEHCWIDKSKLLQTTKSTKTKTKTTNQLEFIKSEVMTAMVLAASSQFTIPQADNGLELGSMDLATN